MPLIPLFTKAELQAAFGLVLPVGPAAEAAGEWWTQFADQSDGRGYFLYDQDPDSPALRPTNIIAGGPRLSTAEETAQQRLFWGGMSVADRRELLMRFSSFHFKLVGLVSDELFERMRLAEGLSLDAAERGRAQMRRIVAAIQAGQE